MPYLIPDGSSSFGQAWAPQPAKPLYWAKFRLLDQKGVPLSEVKVHVRMEDDPAAAAGLETTTTLFTDKDGVFSVQAEAPKKYVSLTPLFKQEGNPAILWRYPAIFSPDRAPDKPLTVVNQPGGGIQAEFPGAPKPLPPPAPPILPTPTPTVTMVVETPPFGAVAAIGVLSLCVGYVLLSRIFPR